jgi:hypothetical protein
MQDVEYSIRLPMPGNEDDYELCRCLNVDALADLIRGLMASDVSGVHELKIIRHLVLKHKEGLQ